MAFVQFAALYLLLVCAPLATPERQAKTVEPSDYLLGFRSGRGSVASLSASPPVHFSVQRDSPAFAFVSQAEAFARAGRLADAAAAYERALSGTYALGDDATASVSLALGTVYAAAADVPRAEAALRSAASSGGRKLAAAAHGALGSLFSREGRFADATRELTIALALRPSWFAALHDLGGILIVRGEVEAGFARWREALDALRSDGVDVDQLAAVEGSARVERSKRRLELGDVEALIMKHVVSAFREARSDSKEGTLTAAERGASLASFIDEPNFDLGLFHATLGHQLLEAGAFSEGRMHLSRGGALLSADMAGPLALTADLAVPLVHAGKSALALARATLSRTVREALEARKRALHPERIKDLYPTTYQLPFFGLPVHLLMADIATWLATADAPSLAVTAPRIAADYGNAANALATPRNPLRPPTIRVGIVSFQTFDCAVGHTLLGIIRRLHRWPSVANESTSSAGSGSSVDTAGDSAASLGRARSPLIGPSPGGGAAPRYLTRDGANWAAPNETPSTRASYTAASRFHVTLFRITRIGDTLTTALVSASNATVRVPGQLEPLRDAIAAAHIDVLLVADPGIQSVLYTLLFSRTAPVQIALWGSDTAAPPPLGLPATVDFSIVPDAATPRDAQSHALEQLVRIGDISPGVSGQRSRSTQNATTRLAVAAEHGLLENSHLYVVLAIPLSTFGPAFDEVISSLIAADAAAEIIVLVERGTDLWLAILRRRLFSAPIFSRTPAARMRVRFVEDAPTIVGSGPTPLRAALFSLADTVLDTFPVGSGFSAIDALLAGTPVVTLPSLQPACRAVSAALERLDLQDELIASNVTDFVAKAVRAASDTTFRAALRRSLAARSTLLEWRDSQNSSRAFLDSTQGLSDSDARVLEAARERGLGDAAHGALSEWAVFIERAGRPWATARALLVKEKSAKVNKETGASHVRCPAHQSAWQHISHPESHYSHSPQTPQRQRKRERNRRRGAELEGRSEITCRRRPRSLRILAQWCMFDLIYFLCGHFRNCGHLRSSTGTMVGVCQGHEESEKVREKGGGGGRGGGA